MGNFFGDLWNMGTKNTNFDPYAPVGAAKQVGGQVMDAVKSPGYDTAAAGAKEAQAYLQQLSQLAWDRQMQGLQGALGQFNNYDALSQQMIPRHGGPLPGNTPFNPGGGGGNGLPTGVPPGQEGKGTFGSIADGAFAPGGIRDKLRDAGRLPGGNPMPTGSTGYVSPRTPTSIPSNAPPELPPPGANAPPSLPPPGAPPALPPPGAPPALAPPGGASTPSILTMLSAMTRGGRGHF